MISDIYSFVFKNDPDSEWLKAGRELDRLLEPDLVDIRAVSGFAIRWIEGFSRIFPHSTRWYRLFTPELMGQMNDESFCRIFSLLTEVPVIMQLSVKYMLGLYPYGYSYGGISSHIMRMFKEQLDQCIEQNYKSGRIGPDIFNDEIVAFYMRTNPSKLWNDLKKREPTEYSDPDMFCKMISYCPQLIYCLLTDRYFSKLDMRHKVATVTNILTFWPVCGIQYLVQLLESPTVPDGDKKMIWQVMNSPRWMNRLTQRGYEKSEKFRGYTLRGIMSDARTSDLMMSGLPFMELMFTGLDTPCCEDPPADEFNLDKLAEDNLCWPNFRFQLDVRGFPKKDVEHVIKAHPPLAFSAMAHGERLSFMKDKDEYWKYVYAATVAMRFVKTDAGSFGRFLDKKRNALVKWRDSFGNTMAKFLLFDDPFFGTYMNATHEKASCLENEEAFKKFIRDNGLHEVKNRFGVSFADTVGEYKQAVEAVHGYKITYDI